MPLTSQRAPPDVRHLVLQYLHRQVGQLGTADRADVGFRLVMAIAAAKRAQPAGRRTKNRRAPWMRMRQKMRYWNIWMNAVIAERVAASPVGVGVSGDRSDTG
jgi:hypothetical protein